MRRAVLPAALLYRYYFRVETFGIERIPRGPRAADLEPRGAASLRRDDARRRDAPRGEPAAHRARHGRVLDPAAPLRELCSRRAPAQLVGTPENCAQLLEGGECVMVFPEGVRGMNKTFDQRYQLQRFGNGFMRLALETKTPIVPVGIVGSEEQQPSLVNLRAARPLLGMPAFPITPTFPLARPARPPAAPGALPHPLRRAAPVLRRLQRRGRGDRGARRGGAGARSPASSSAVWRSGKGSSLEQARARPRVRSRSPAARTCAMMPAARTAARGSAAPDRRAHDRVPGGAGPAARLLFVSIAGLDTLRVAGAGRDADTRRAGRSGRRRGARRHDRAGERVPGPRHARHGPRAERPRHPRGSAHRRARRAERALLAREPAPRREPLAARRGEARADRGARLAGDGGRRRRRAPPRRDPGAPRRALRRSSSPARRRPRSPRRCATQARRARPRRRPGRCATACSWISRAA